MDGDFEDSRYENERYEDSDRSYYDQRQARRMSSQHDSGRENGRRAQNSRSGNWDSTAEARPWSYAQSEDRSGQSRERGVPSRDSRDYSESRPRAQFDNQDYGMSYDQQAPRSEPGQYSRGGGYRGSSSPGYRESSQRPDGGYRSDQRSRDDYGDDRNFSGTGRMQNNDRDWNDRDSRSDRFEPYSQGGRVYQDRYAQGPARGQDNYDRYSNDDRSFSSGSLGAQDRYEEGRSNNRNRTSGYRSQEPSFMGRDREQNPRGRGRYGQEGSSGAQRSNNNYLDESDDGYRYAYGSDSEEMSQSRRTGASRSSSDSQRDSERGDFDNQRSIQPGRARYAHGSEMQEDADEAENFASRGSDSETLRPETKNGKAASKGSSRTAKSARASTKKTAAGKSSSKSARKGTKAEIDSRTTVDV